ncbi:phage/plasmid replication protein, II/X family [Acidovorax sp. M2(2025)]|uniref:phage/plasmid replication protein, II/X family n=1 Tax=Acidovorax sp. M2(2025) TaxID=3411355 RepID=UPI003BF5F457
MLTPKKVFVDTIVTQLSLLSSGVLTEAEESQDGPPRAKRIVVPGTYQDKNLHTLHFPGKGILMLEGSVIGYCQGHNVFGSCDVPSLVLDAHKAMHTSGAFTLSKQDRLRVQGGDIVELKRLDVGVNFALPDGVSATRALVELAHEMVDKGMNTSTYGYGETVYRNQHSQSSALKFYDKAKELTDNKGLPANLPNREVIMDFAKSVIRCEVVLRHPKLKAMEMTKPKDCTFTLLKSELENAIGRMSLKRSVRVGLTALDLRDVKPMYHTTYRCWEHGDDLQALLEPKAYKRQVDYFKSIGFDITTQPSVSSEEVPLGDIFTLSNAVEPPPELWGDDDDAEAVEC